MSNSDIDPMLMSVIDIIAKLPDAERIFFLENLKLTCPSYIPPTIQDVFEQAVSTDNDTMYYFLKFININNVNSEGTKHLISPIMYAAQNGNIRMVEILLKMKAEISGNKNGSALFYALSHNRENNFQCAKMLMEAGAIIDSCFETHNRSSQNLPLYFNWLFKKPTNPSSSQ